MVVTQQMQNAMDDKMKCMTFNRFFLLFGFALDRLEGQHDIAERQGALGKNAQIRLFQRCCLLVLAARGGLVDE